MLDIGESIAPAVRMGIPGLGAEGEFSSIPVRPITAIALYDFLIGRD